MNRHFIAIDGGGTKTDVVWFDEAGHVIRRVIGQAANPNGLSQEHVRFHLQEIFTKLFEGATDISKIKGVFGGFAGGSHPHVQNSLRSILIDLLPESIKIRIDHDAINALWSGTHGEAGLVLIAGTGSVVYGVNDHGETFRVGGWGYLIGDEGSGYAIGQMAAVAVMKAYDGRGTPTELTSLVLQHFNKKNEPDLIPLIYSDGKSSLSALVPLVAKAARFGDSVAIEIINTSAAALSELVLAGVSHFSTPLKRLVMVGGLKNLGDLLLCPLEQYIAEGLPRIHAAEKKQEQRDLKILNTKELTTDHKQTPIMWESEKIKIVFPDAPPVYGAAIECLRIMNILPTDSFTKNFIDGMKN